MGPFFPVGGGGQPPRKVLLPGEEMSPAQREEKIAKGEVRPGLYLPDGRFVRSRDLERVAGAAQAKAAAGVSAVGLKVQQRGELKVALAQMEVKAGMPLTNVKEMVRQINAAKKQGVNLIVFPEMCIGGYLQGDAWRSDANCEDLMSYNDIIKSASRGITVAWGNICLDRPEDMTKRGISGYHPNKDGTNRRYNAIYVAQDGKWAKRKVEHSFLPPGVQAKTLLPNYGFFDDERYFYSLDDVAKDFGTKLDQLQQPFLLKVGGKTHEVGFTCCEDMWCKTYREAGQALNPTRMLVDNGAERVVNISSSPWVPGKEAARDEAVQFLKQDLGDRFVPLYYCAHTGEMNNGKNFIPFDGGSRVYNADGKPIAAAQKMFEAQTLVVSDVKAKPIEEKPYDVVGQKIDAIIRGIRHLRDSGGFKAHPKFVIGLSGGIDSSVSAALLHLAMKDEPGGDDKIVGINMPTKYNSDATKSAAKKLADKLGVQYHVIPIEKPVAVIEKTIQKIPVDGEKKELSSLLKQNVQAKVRGCDVQSNVAQHVGGVFVNNGNKLEVALGYATLYGDWGGAMSVLGDLTKAEVYQIASYLNEQVFGDEVIPNELIPDELFRFGKDKIKPSAELAEDMVDPIKVGYHCAMLDAMTSKGNASPQDFMRWWQEGTLHTHLGISADLMKRYGVDDPKKFVEDLDWFASTITKQTYKRVQSPPIILVSSAAYGYDIRESLLPYRETKIARELKKAIMDEGKGYEPKPESTVAVA